MKTKDLSVPQGTESVDRLSQWFLRFSDQAVNSPMYQFLAQKIANDRSLLSLAAVSNPSQPAPNLFLAAVHFLLLEDSSDELSNWYPSCGGVFAPNSQLWEAWRRFALKNRDKITILLQSRLVQTNEIRRSGAIRLGLAHIANEATTPVLALVELGTSAGLNLSFDHYNIVFRTELQQPAPLGSPDQLVIELRGLQTPPSFPEDLRITHRMGIDLNPLDLNDPEDERWLRALVWPDQPDRLRVLDQAIAWTKSAGLHLRRGSCLDLNLLTQIATEIPKTSCLVFLHSFTINQLSAAERETFALMFCKLSEQHPCWRLSFEWIGKDVPELEVFKYESGALTDRQLLARCHDHGRWIEWLR